MYPKVLKKYEKRILTLKHFCFSWLNDDMLNAITPKLLGNKPNTYTYTKQLAETLLKEEAADLPLAIVRPSIVTEAWQEPLPVSANISINKLHFSHFLKNHERPEGNRKENNFTKILPNLFIY